MFRDMRRSKQQLTEAENIEILKQGTYGVLSVAGEDGYPYGVPVNYVYEDGKIYIHGANAGHKIDAIRRNSKVTFCVVDKSDVIKEEYTTRYRSVIAFGKAKIVADEREILAIAEKLAIRFWPEDTKEHRDRVIANDIKVLGIIEIELEHVTGKQQKALVK